jgi:hypothetical protein
MNLSSQFNPFVICISPSYAHQLFSLLLNTAFAMFSVICAFLSFLPLKLRFHLLRLRARFLVKCYIYFRTPMSTSLCQVCRDTLQKKYGGYTQTHWNEPIRGNGQELFETFGRVTCPHHTSIQSLKTSVDKNCMICVRLWLSLGDDVNLLQDLDLQGDPLTYCYIAQAAEDNLDTLERGGNNCFLMSVGVPVNTEESTGYAEDELSSLNVPITGKHSSSSTRDARLCNLNWALDPNASRDAEHLLPLLLRLMNHFCWRFWICDTMRRAWISDLYDNWNSNSN